ncbi:uncharacterized protein LOC135073406 [Ostrinia nubilalis]|uniref:uncharacterized protein LOC135073406 n=1 Tax=Ostrinia nubilalis TaxID=29057 RepID=UPI00308237D3
MGATREYFKDQFSVNKLTLDHGNASEFYVGWWQTGQSAVHLLCLRLILFLGCIGIFTTSLVMTSEAFSLNYWAIYMTHWGVFMIMVTSGLAFMVSLIACINGDIDADFGLPWYVRVYWASLVITVPVAYFITIFYYSFLTALGKFLFKNYTFNFSSYSKLVVTFL